MSDATPRLFDDEQVRRLRDIHRVVDRTQPPREMLRDLAATLADIVGGRTALVERRDGAWTTLAASPGSLPLPPAGDPAWHELTRTAQSLGRGALVWRTAPAEWTVVGLRAQTAGAPLLLVLEGDWSPSGSTLLQLARDLTFADRAAALAAHAHLTVTTHRLTRALARTTGERGVCAAALRALVRAVPSRIGSFAVPTEDGPLMVMATHGYPLTLVEHLRIPSGAGVIGTIHQTRMPLRVPDVAVFGPEYHRPRYRTRAFLAVPVVAGGEVLGVVALTDRVDGGVYSREDQAVVRRMLAPVSLALSRERQRRQAEAFRRAAAMDAATRLYNKGYFLSRLDEELQRSRRTDAAVAVLMIDLDDFKPINDRYGHLAGDIVLADVADILRRSVRAFDVCARFGGEEFAVLMPGNPEAHATSTAERIRQRIEAYRPADPALADIRVTVSIGLAVADASSTAPSLIERADRALYAAKRAGKNRLSIDPLVPRPPGADG